MHLPNEDLCAVDRLKPYDNNARTHSKKQIDQIAKSIERFGFTNPVLVADDDTIVAGHGRVQAAKRLGMKEVPIRRLSHLMPDEVRAYVLADNRLAENAGWDANLLAIELQGLIDIDFDLELTGFDTTEIDIILDGEQEKGPVAADACLDYLPETNNGPAISQIGHIWQLGPHRLICGDATDEGIVRRLCLAHDGTVETPRLLFTDPPYNVPIYGHVSGLGKQKHREFAQASGEMDQEEFVAFLTNTLRIAATVLADGSIAYVCMDWRHIGELLEAGNVVFEQLKNVCVWNKTNAGMGSFYRSKHELVFVFKKGSSAHINNFGLGEGGRYRTNVWDYAGISSLGPERDAQLAMHPTVKPVALVADAIRDCSNRGDIVLDVFGGSGSTLIAAETTGRKARLVELDPLYCDTIIRRWQDVTGAEATLVSTGKSLDELQIARAMSKSKTEGAPARDVPGGGGSTAGASKGARL